MFRRLFAAVLGLLATAIGALILAFVLSPWPSALIIAHLFAGNDAASQAALEVHVPQGIETIANARYGNGDDEFMDINRPENAPEPLPLVIWVHGGAWIGGSKAGVANYLKILAAPGFVTVGIDYSTAPVANYPMPVQQLNRAIDHLVSNAEQYGIDASRIFLAGDSAGAQIAGQMAAVATDAGYAERVGIAPTLAPEHLRGVVLVSGAFDITSVQSATGMQGWLVNTVLWAYSGVRDYMGDEQFLLASVTPNASTSYPPTFIASGDEDPLAPQAHALAERLGMLGVPVSSVFFEPGTGLGHEFQFNLDTPQGQHVLDRMIEFLQSTR